MNDAMDKTRKEDLKKFFKLLKELNIDEEIIYQKVSETFAMTDETQEFTFEYGGAEKEKVSYAFTFEDEPTLQRFL